MKSVKTIATGVAALGAIGAAAIGVTSIASVPAGGAAQVQLAAVGAPLPQDPPPPAPAPAAGVPTADQLTGVLNTLADPSVSFTSKGNLVEGGIGGTEAHIADHKLQKAAKNGDLPLSFNITNIAPAAGGSVTADVAVSGPKLPNPVTQNVTFVNNQGGWILSRSSAMELLQAAGH
ncbi:MAG TPA: hypothetical protein VGN92_04085 [Mycobacterium sp.]|jgi:hypothetical protein|nr:hypothetical protein [Mycobacterium sp.]